MSGAKYVRRSDAPTIEWADYTEVTVDIESDIVI